MVALYIATEKRIGFVCEKGWQSGQTWSQQSVFDARVSMIYATLALDNAYGRNIFYS